MRLAPVFWTLRALLVLPVAVASVGLLSACASPPSAAGTSVVPEQGRAAPGERGAPGEAGEQDSRVARRAQPQGEEGQGAEGEPSDWIVKGEQALADGQPARAAALFARYLGANADINGASRAYVGLARAHEQLGDFEAAIRAYDGFLARFPDDPQVTTMLARRGACEAEIFDWRRSAASFAEILVVGGEGLLPSERVEALARQGLALFQLGELDEADAVLATADEIYTTATEAGAERFSDTYFVSMARFYRAGILHVRFRQAPIRLPEAQMTKDFEHKLELLERAQKAYNEVIRARHVYWVSAAGYQLGTLFEEFYDAVMHAPVPDWLDESQRGVYYAELEEELRPVVEKAVWVFEKNLETARKLGYESDFIDQTRDRLAQLQSIMLGRDGTGSPIPRLAPSLAPEQDYEDQTSSLEALPGVERKLFVPLPTTL